jgi:tetratricopeptide (TPR) repeat protein
MRKYLKLGLLSILFLSGLPAGADQFLDREVTTVEMLRSQAMQAQLQGNADEALDKYQQALEPATRIFGANAPYLAELYYDMGSLCLSSSKFERAEGFLNQALKLNPNLSAAHLRLAELKLLQSRFASQSLQVAHANEAARHAAAVLSRHRDDLVAHKALAQALETSDDSRRAYQEYAAVDCLVQYNRDLYDGKPVAPRVALAAIAPARPLLVPAPPARVDETKKKAEAEAARKKAEQDKKDEELKKKVAEARKLAGEETRKKAEKEARKKAEQARKKASQEKKAPPPSVPSQGEKATLSSKAVLLTPVIKKKATAGKPAAPAAGAPSASAEETAAAPKAPPAKKPARTVEETPKPVTPKPGKHAPGLVPPPPPVVPTFMMPPPQSVPPPKPKPQPKKEEKPKEPPAVKEEKTEKPSNPDEEGDFLLDWGGAKGKKKK